MKFSSLLLTATTLTTSSAFQLPRGSVSSASANLSLSSSIPSEDPTTGKPAAPMTPPTSEDPLSSSSASTSTSESSSSFEMPSSFQDIKMPAALQDLQKNNPFQDLQFSDITKTITDSFKDSDGEFGSRGEIYVAGQAVLLLAILIGGGVIPFLDPLLHLTGPVLLLTGLAGIVLTVKEMGSSLSPFTTPRSSSSTLITTGPFAYVRHPLYSALLTLCTGWAMVTDSASRLVLTAMLVALLYVKTSEEEDKMVDKYGEAYTAYQTKVTGRFLPLEWLKETKEKVL